MLAKILTLIAIFFSFAANADISCPSLFQKDENKDTYYILMFLGGSGTGSASRQAKRAQLESLATLKMQDYVMKLSERVSDTDLNVELITCDFPMGAADLNRIELEDLSRRNVLASIWGGVEGDKPSVIHVSLPHYQRRTGNRRSAEVAWLRVVTTNDELDDWRGEFSRNGVMQQALLALEVGLIATGRSDWPLAKRSLCQVRSNIKLLVKEAVRPSANELEQELQRVVSEAIKQVDDGARAKGVDLNKYVSIKLACSV